MKAKVGKAISICRCRRCNHVLSKTSSRKLGYGPVCYGKTLAEKFEQTTFLGRKQDAGQNKAELEVR